MVQLPIGIQANVKTETDLDRNYILKLEKSLYGLKHVSFNWYKKLKTALVDRNFKPSDTDPCLYIGNGMLVLTYIDDCIIVGPKMKEIGAFIQSICKKKKKFSS